MQYYYYYIRLLYKTKLIEFQKETMMLVETTMMLAETTMLLVETTIYYEKKLLL